MDPTLVKEWFHSLIEKEGIGSKRLNLLPISSLLPCVRRIRPWSQDFRYVRCGLLFRCALSPASSPLGLREDSICLHSSVLDADIQH